VPQRVKLSWSGKWPFGPCSGISTVTVFGNLYGDGVGHGRSADAAMNVSNLHCPGSRGRADSSSEVAHLLGDGVGQENIASNSFGSRFHGGRPCWPSKKASGLCGGGARHGRPRSSGPATPVLSEAAPRAGRRVAQRQALGGSCRATRGSAPRAENPRCGSQAVERAKLSCEPANLLCCSAEKRMLQHPGDVANNGIRRVSCSALLSRRSSGLPGAHSRACRVPRGCPGPWPGQRRACLGARCRDLAPRHGTPRAVASSRCGTYSRGRQSGRSHSPSSSHGTQPR
jgi:hypothetical protein